MAKAMKVLGLMLALLCVVFLGMFVISASADMPEVGDAVTLKSYYVAGCANKAATARLLSLTQQGDTSAAGQLAHIARCDYFRADEPLVLQIKEPFDALWCVRRVGEPHCLWMDKSMVMRQPKATQK